MGLEWTTIKYIVVIIHCSSANAQWYSNRDTRFIDDRYVRHVKVMAGYGREGFVETSCCDFQIISIRALDTFSINAHVTNLKQRSTIFLYYPLRICIPICLMCEYFNLDKLCGAEWLITRAILPYSADRWSRYPNTRLQEYTNPSFYW